MRPYRGYITGSLQHHGGRLPGGELQTHRGQAEDWELACLGGQRAPAFQVPGGAFGHGDPPPERDLALSGPEQLMVAAALVGQPEMILAWPGAEQASSVKS